MGCMDFKTVLGILLKQLEEQQIDYAFIGGFAMGAFGILRSTMDLDLLVHKDDLPRLDSILTAQLYRRQYHSENVSQYVSDLQPLGNIDLLHAFREHTLAMLQRAKIIPVFHGQYDIRVVIPEDLIGLKLQALNNDPARQTIDGADIELLLQHFRHALDWQLLEDYFTLFQRQEEFKELKSRYGNSE